MRAALEVVRAGKDPDRSGPATRHATLRMVEAGDGRSAAAVRKIAVNPRRGRGSPEDNTSQLRAMTDRKWKGRMG